MDALAGHVEGVPLGIGIGKGEAHFELIHRRLVGVARIGGDSAAARVGQGRGAKLVLSPRQHAGQPDAFDRFVDIRRQSYLHLFALVGRGENPLRISLIDGDENFEFAVVLHDRNGIAALEVGADPLLDLR